VVRIFGSPLQLVVGTCYLTKNPGLNFQEWNTLSSFLAGQLVKLDSLALYWNTKDDIGKLPTQEDWVVIVLLFLPYYAVILVTHNVSTGVFTPEDSCFHGNAWFEF